MGLKSCPCAKGKSEEKYIECPFSKSEGCPCNLNNCIIYAIYENGESTNAAMKKIAENLRAR